MIRSIAGGSFAQGLAGTRSSASRYQSIRSLSTAPPHAKTATYANQSKVPRLPIPDLERSMEAYVKSLVPLLEQKYSGGNLQKEVEKRKIYARDFVAPGGLGRHLHERLKDLDHISPNNWLDDTLWLKLAYHTWRAPLLVNSNWWLSFKADPSDPPPPSYGSANDQAVPDSNPTEDLPAGSQGGGQEYLDGGDLEQGMVSYDEATTREWITPYQIKKAAWVIQRFADYRMLLQKGEVEPESTKSGPLCMAQYQKLFNFSRIPLPGSDGFSAIAPNALHTTLIIDDFYYSVDIFLPSANASSPEPLAAAEIETRIRAAVEDAKARKDRGEKPDMVGILTGDERDSWTKNREKIVHLSPKNRENLNSISTSLIALSLDPYTIPSVTDGDPLRSPAVDAQTRNASCGLDGARNRWLDKAISVMIETNGRTSLLGEHSPVDAIVPSNIVNHVLAEPFNSEQTANSALPQEGDGWKRLDWVIDEGMTKEIKECQERNKAIIADSDNSNLLWGEFATAWIKQDAKVSPDSFIQQALQLAWFRDQGYVSATYESASTRGFLHGRTETIRSVTSESRAFVKAMLDSKVEDKKRYDLLLKACSAHNDLSRAGASGQGIDRYLMGLKVQLRDGETHALFDDEFYAKSQEWKLSTSAFSPGQNFLGIGFGAAWPDGYGINYQPGKHLIKFGIESKVSSAATSTRRFKHHLVQALRDMRRICESMTKSV